MACPGEFECAVFADGELEPAEAQPIAEHLETCRNCEALVNAFRQESLLLVQTFQEGGLELFQVHGLSPVPGPASVLRFGLCVAGLAALLRLSFSVIADLELPSAIAWLDPRSISIRLGVAINALLYALEDGGSLMTNVLQTMSFAALLTLFLVGIAAVRRRSAVTSAMLGTILCFAMLSPAAYAIDVRSGPASTLAADSTVDDTLIVFGDSITINGTVNGDLIAFGRQVTVTGKVAGDVIAFARRVDISGSVGGNVFGAAQDLEVTGPVARNFYGAGNTILIGRAARIAGNATTASESAIVDGQIGMDLVAVGSSLDARGEIARHIMFRGRQLSLLEPAHVGGNLSARIGTSENVRVDSGVTIAGNRNVQLQEPPPSRYSTVRFYVWQLLRVAAALLTGVALFWIFPALASGAVGVSREWLKAGSIGFMAVIVIPIAAIIVGVTLIGLPVAFAALVLWIAGLYVSKILVAEFVGRSIVKEGRALPLLMGLILVFTAVNLPYVGGLINVVLVFLGFGTLLLVTYRGLQPAKYV